MVYKKSMLKSINGMPGPPQAMIGLDISELIVQKQVSNTIKLVPLQLELSGMGIKVN